MPSTNEDGDQQKLLNITDGIHKVTANSENSLAVSYKIKHKHTI